MIRPKEIETTILDIGVLSAYPDVKGVVLKLSAIPNQTFENDSLTGYRLEYYDQSGVKINNFFKIITSNNRCEPVNQNVTSSSQKSIRYRFNDSSDLMFLTVTPSSASTIKANSVPFIGNPGSRIILSNTFFNPTMIEIEMTENDVESLYTTINGNQIRNLDKGLITTYDKNNQIYDQKQYYLIKEDATGTAIYDVKETQTSIDFTQDHDTIVGSV